MYDIDALLRSQDNHQLQALHARGCSWCLPAADRERWDGRSPTPTLAHHPSIYIGYCCCTTDCTASGQARDSTYSKDERETPRPSVVSCRCCCERVISIHKTVEQSIERAGCPLCTWSTAVVLFWRSDVIRQRDRGRKRESRRVYKLGAVPLLPAAAVFCTP